MRLIFAVVSFLALALSAPLALAQELPPAVSTEIGAITTALSAGRSQKWLMLVACVLSLAILLFRRFGAGVLGARAKAWVNTDRGGLVVALAITGLTTFITQAIAGTLGWQTLLDVVTNLVTTAGTFSVFKKALAPSDKAAAEAK